MQNSIYNYKKQVNTDHQKKPFEGEKLKHVLIAIFVICAGSLNVLGTVPHRDELKIGINQGFDTLNPALAETSAAKYLIYFAHRPLVFIDRDNLFKPVVVKKIPNLNDKSAHIVVENGVKKLVADWEFVKDFKWGDGTPVTCKDLKFSWQLGLSANVSTPNRSSYENIESINWNELSPTKCSIKYKVAKWNFFLNTPDPLPSHLEADVLKSYGQTKIGYDQNTWYQKDPTKKGLWNGPYVLSESKLGSHLIFTVNEHYFGRKPKIKKIIITLISNSGSLESNLRSKTIDMIARMGLSLDQALVFSKKILSDNLPYEVKYQNGLTYVHIDMNLSHSILKDISIRRALSYALNKKELIDSIFEGQGQIAYHFSSPIDTLYSDDKSKITVYEFNTKKAKKILEDAGWKTGPDNFRYKNGQKLKFTLVAAGGVKLNETIQIILQSQWKSIGADLEISIQTGRFLFTELLPKRNFDMALYSWSSFPGESPESVLHSKNIPSKENAWAGQNYSGFSNVKMDKLIAGYDFEFNAEKRKKTMFDILNLYTQEIPTIPLYFRVENAVIPKGMKGFRLTGHLFYESLQSEDWEF